MATSTASSINTTPSTQQDTASAGEDISASSQAKPQPFVDPSEYGDLKVTFTSQEINDIRKSWNGLKDDPSAQQKATVHGTASAFFCQQFYENLLGEYPELKVLFPSIKSQASSMAGILSLVISQLDNLQRVHEILISLGKRHSRIVGVEVIHYELVGNALLRTLQDRTGDLFTIDLENSWIKLYSYMANLMLQAGEDPPAPAQSHNNPQQALYPVLTPTSSFSSNTESSHQYNKNLQDGRKPSQGPPPTAPANNNNNGEVQGYNPAHSYFRSKKNKKRTKDKDCIVM